ncbi:LexA family transcriptional regulator [Flavobacterium sp. xlx-214]|uniref:XRE family transcriptional regulator n=1 Tax=unclassified Flavobacterium TaxID=196869 RepID=UPI0013D7A915|nr:MULTISPECIES: LexA family transcriptional regulator [unclassified Flavobacterium]MBA5791595.1 LexA family transcriptional regulator [Flavobacterium sp. xlx-221]QMI82842.1 LexA family transcriptional regulator [Flavobacterium sp. xlx-214]
MSFLSENIRYLRNQLGQSQQKVADSLLITRGRYAKYEDGISEPPLELLIKISRYYYVSIDLLVSVDLKNIPLKELMELPDNRILLPIKVDVFGEPKIEIIPHKASMGYLGGYSDPEYIEGLQTLSLPFLGVGKYRAFPAEGDSMPPHKNGSYIIGKYIDHLNQLKEGKTYVFITRNEGITYKRLQHIQEDALQVQADNERYPPYAIALTDVMELWEYACSIATEEFNTSDFHIDHQAVISMFHELKTDLQQLKKERNAY